MCIQFLSVGSRLEPSRYPTALLSGICDLHFLYLLDSVGQLHEQRKCLWMNRSRKRRLACEKHVDGTCGRPSLGNRPHDQRRPAMRVAADEYAGCPGLPPDITLDSAEWIGADIKGR